MRRTFGISILAFALFAGFAAGSSPAARASDAVCTLAGVAGSFGFSYSGLAVLPSGPVPLAAVGKFHSDATGNFTGSEVNSLAGTAAFQTISGTITMGQGCAAELVANVYQGGQLARTSYIHLQYQNNATEILAIFEKVVLPDKSVLPVVVTISGKRI